jgi:hypothetical protein
VLWHSTHLQLSEHNTPACKEVVCSKVNALVYFTLLCPSMFYSAKTFKNASLEALAVLF